MRRSPRERAKRSKDATASKSDPLHMHPGRPTGHGERSYPALTAVVTFNEELNRYASGGWRDRSPCATPATGGMSYHRRLSGGFLQFSHMRTRITSSLQNGMAQHMHTRQPTCLTTRGGS